MKQGFGNIYRSLVSIYFVNLQPNCKKKYFGLEKDFYMTHVKRIIEITVYVGVEVAYDVYTDVKK